MATIRPFTAALRKDGFTKQCRDRSGGTTITQFAKRIGDREVHVQLCADGRHRASHGTYSVINGFDCLYECTTPTDFKTTSEMMAAVSHEFQRPSTPRPVR